MDREQHARNEGYRRLKEAALQIHADLPGLTVAHMAAMFARLVASAILAADPADREVVREYMINCIDYDLENAKVGHVQ